MMTLMKNVNTFSLWVLLSIFAWFFVKFNLALLIKLFLIKKGVPISKNFMII